MNYIPGFSNYLETSMPRYAVGGRAMGVEPMMYDGAPIMGDGINFRGSEMVVPAIQPMAQEAVPFDFSGLDLSGLNNLYGLNFGTDFGGGAMGGQYQADPNMQYIGAPKSNKGNATSQTGGNTFAVRADQPVRLVDHRTNQVVFEGTGYDAARKATEMGQSLTNQFGRKANYSIQTADPSGSYSTVAYEKKNKSTLGKIADVVGTVAPLALGFVPGFGQLGLLTKMGAAAGAGGLGAALKGDNILKGALLGGATAGVVGGTGLDKAIGGALSGVGKGAVQGATQGAAQGLSDDIVVNALSKLAQGAGGALGQAAISQAGKAGLSEITGYKTPAEQFAQQATPVDDTIVVSANRLASGSGLPFGAAVPIPASTMLSGALAAAQPVPAEQPATQEPVDDEILVKARKSFLPPETLAAVPAIGGLMAATGGGAPNVVDGVDQATGDIVVEGPKSVTPPLPIAGIETAFPAITQGALTPAQTSSTPPKDGLTTKEIVDYLRLASLGVSAVGGLLGGDKGRSSGTLPAGMGALSSLFSKQLPTSTLPTGSAGGGALPATALAGQGLRSPQDYYRYGYGPEQSFFDYATQGAPNTSRAYTGYEGSTAEDLFAAQPPRLPQPITTPIPNNPAGPSMYLPDMTRFAEGGYAVEGAGDGRDDKIPALLSDGEYVIDAETVALLGNGSNKAGAELLDSFRVNVRKQKGKKLARGEFSDNAKRPEHYMVGGHA
jgi:hypothetical protein